MKAFLLAAGRGTRLGNLTARLPKCLVPIRGRPLLDVWIDRLAKAGFSKVRLNTHHLANVVEAHVREAKYPIEVTTHFENQLLGTAGSLCRHQEWLSSGDVLVAHADNYSLFDIAAFMKAHQQRVESAIMTMLAFRTPTPESCGIIEVDSRRVLLHMWEKSREDHGNLANAAIYALTPSVLPYLEGAFDFSTDVIPKLFKKISVVETDRTHIDIGTPESLQLAQHSG